MRSTIHILFTQEKKMQYAIIAIGGVWWEE